MEIAQETYIYEESRMYKNGNSSSSYSSFCDSSSNSCSSTSSSYSNGCSSYINSRDEFMSMQMTSLNLKKAPVDVNLLNDNRILQNLLHSEENYCIQSNYFQYVQKDIKPWMRNVLANWMLEVCVNQNCEDDVFVLAMNILDRFLNIQPISKRYLQLLGAVCLFIASKVRCAVPLSAETLVFLTDKSIDLEELLNWEQYVVQKLRWDISSVTANDFVPHLVEKISTIADENTLKVIRQNISSFIALCSTDFRFSILSPSMIASGCILATMTLLKLNQDIYNRVAFELNRTTSIELECLKECKEQINELINSNFQMNPESAEKFNQSSKC